MPVALINNNIFNTDKTDYAQTPLFLGQQKAGLIDSINKPHPEIFKLYKKLKSLDWDENEFSFKSCNVEFKTCSKSVYDMMLLTLAWQWEADSIASRSLVPIIAPFVSSSTLFVAYARVGDNENVHSLTYSEIVRNSFDNPDEVFKEILSRLEPLKRIQLVAEVFAEAYEASHRYALGELENNQETYNKVFKFIVANYVLERLQFMSSFAVTFAVADSGSFLPIGKAVQKICQDELEIHAKLGSIVLDIELGTERGLMAFNQLRSWIIAFIEAVIESEFNWIDYLFSEGRQLAGVTPELLKGWVLLNAKQIYAFFRITPTREMPTRNSMGFLDDWIDIGRQQPSPQEEKNGQYLLGAVVNDLSTEEIEIDL